MTARFASNLSVLIIGAFLAYGRGPAQRLVDVAMALMAGWTAVSALTFSAPVVGWLSVGEGGALASLALIGLVAHEVVMERAVWQG